MNLKLITIKVNLLLWLVMIDWKSKFFMNWNSIIYSFWVPWIFDLVRLRKPTRKSESCGIFLSLWILGKKLTRLIWKNISLKYQYILPCKELDVEKNIGRGRQSKRKFSRGNRELEPQMYIHFFHHKKW
jgi:hypothetical protein